MAFEDIKINTFAAIVLCRLEPKIGELLKKIRYFFDVIVVVMDVVNDPTLSDVDDWNSRIHKIRVVHSAEGNFNMLRNLGDGAAKDCLWHLHIDPDETFDRRFLIKKEMIVRKFNTLSFRFPRINLPHHRNYPDYQVRLFRYDGDNSIEWRGRRHEYLWHNPSNQRLDAYDCITLDDYKIIHNKRRTDLKRDWW